MERFGATKNRLKFAKPLKEMVGTRRLELLTSTVTVHPRKYPRCFVSPKLEAGDRPAEDAITIGSLALGHPRLARPRQTGN
jgi:hypothetical protein